MMMRVAILALVASAALAASEMKPSTIVAASSSVYQFWSSTSSASGSWQREQLSTSGISLSSVYGVATCKRDSKMYVFLVTDNNVYRKAFDMTESTGKLTDTTGGWTSIQSATSGSVDYRAVACVDNDLYVVDTQANEILYTPDFTASSPDFSKKVTSTTISEMTNPYGIFVSTTAGAFVDLYFGNHAASGVGGSTDGVYEQKLAYTSSSGFSTIGSPDQWVQSTNAFEIAVDTGGTVWFTPSSSSGSIRRSTGGDSTKTYTDMITGGSFDAGMRFSNERLYFASGSSVYFVSNPVSMSPSTLASASKVTVGSITGNVIGMSVYYAGSAVRAIPTATALFAAVAAAFLSRRFW